MLCFIYRYCLVVMVVGFFVNHACLEAVCRLNKTKCLLSLPFCPNCFIPSSLGPTTSTLEMQMLFGRSFCDFVALSVRLLVSGDLHADKIDLQQEEENSRCRGNW